MIFRYDFGDTLKIIFGVWYLYSERVFSWLPYVAAAAAELSGGWDDYVAVSMILSLGWRQESSVAACVSLLPFLFFMDFFF